MQSLTSQVKTNEEEKCTLKYQLYESEVKIEKLRNALSLLENLQKSKHDLLDNISEFGVRVYQKWNLPKVFATKIQ